jgi:glucose-6-phosphate 1-epimerase
MSLTTTTLTSPDGASVTIYPYGAHVASWITPDGREHLFMSDKSEFRSGAAIRGGIPVIFPQFSTFGSMIRHGFARTLLWDEVEAGHFQLQDFELTRRVWDHAFLLDLFVNASGHQLEVSLQVTNTGSTPFDYTAALHTYLRISDIATISLEGLRGLSYREFGVDHMQTDSPLRIVGETDRIYWNMQEPVIVHDVDQTIEVSKSGFPDVVVWNPGPDKSPVDMTPEGYRSMLCIEAAAIGQPVHLKPGAVWCGTQTITSR